MATQSTTQSDLAATAVPASSSGLWHSVRRRVARWRDANQIAGELQLLSTRELADLGLSQSDIPAVVNGSYRRD